jgi:riboflavin synthase
MFTGIVQAVGSVIAVTPRDGDSRLRVDVSGLARTRLAPGASVAVNGVCLTVTEQSGDKVGFDVSRETLGLTTLSRLEAGSRVNLEPALTLSEPLSGHLVSGHVDGIAIVTAMEPDARSTRLSLRLPAHLTRYVARKGSLCVDGVSLTVNEVSGDEATVNIVPHTLERTIMGSYQVGTAVNVEADLIARYLDRLLQERA